MSAMFPEPAACVGTDPDAFFPEPGDNAPMVKRICAACPARTACLEYALRENLRYGMFGGVSALARKPLHRAYNASVRGAA